MGPLEISLIVLGGLALIAILIISIAVKRNKKKAETNVVETKNARYTFETDTTTESGEAKVSYTKGDIVLNAGTTYKVGTGKDMIKPGKYIILTSNNSTEKFNIRVDGYVREYSHNQEIILADNSEVASVSHSVILR